MNTGILDEIAQAQAGNVPRSYAGGFDPMTARRGPANEQPEGQKQLQELMRVWYDRLLGDPAKSMAAVGDMLRGGLQGPPSGGRYDEMMRPVDPQGVPTGQPSVTDLVDHIQQAMSLYAGPGIVKGMASRPMTNVTPFAAHHGTPHRWPPEPGRPHGRPRLDKIGTGEGAAAYGWGWYSADAPDVAKEYAKNLGQNVYRYKGNAIPENSPQHNAAELLWGTQGDKKEALYYADNYENPNAVRKAIREISYADIKKGGEVYTLDIPDDVAPQLLDWDKSVPKAMYEKVQSALMASGPQISEKNIPDAIGWGDLPNISRLKAKESYKDILAGKYKNGEELYRKLSSVFGGDNKAASEYLRSIGIPGNKYLDAVGRNRVAFAKKMAPDDKAWHESAASYNYVIWDQDVLDRVKILERNKEKLGDTP